MPSLTETLSMVQAENALSPIETRLVGNSFQCNFEQPENALPPIDAKLSGRRMDVRAEQS